MFAIGLILIVLAIIVIGYVIFATGDLSALEIDWGIFNASLTPLQLFFLGAATILVLCVGSLMVGIGLKRAGAKRSEVRRLRKEVKSQEPTKKEIKKENKEAANRGEDHSSAQPPTAPLPRQGTNPGQGTNTQQGTSPGQGANTPPPPPPRA